MSYVKLSQYSRDTIKSMAISASFKKREEALDKLEKQFGDDVYKRFVKATDIALLSTIDKKWLNMETSCYVNFGGMKAAIIFTEERPLPNHPRYNVLWNCADQSVNDRFMSIENMKKQLKTDKDQARAQLKQMLYSLKSLKELEANWPEGKPFYAFLYKKDVRPNLPAVTVDKINAMLGLPLDEEEKVAA